MAGLLARGAQPAPAAFWSVYIHGEAGQPGTSTSRISISISLWRQHLPHRAQHCPHSRRDERPIKCSAIVALTTPLRRRDYISFLGQEPEDRAHAFQIKL